MHAEQFTFSVDWFSSRIEEWAKVLSPLKSQAIDILEIGVFEGRSTVWMVKELLQHPNSTITIIDPFLCGTEARFRHNIAQTGAMGRLNIIKQMSFEALSILNAKKKKTFDLIYIDGDHASQNALEDAVLAWPLLKPGGFIIFDDYGIVTVKTAVDGFLECYQRDLKIISQDWQMIIKKTNGGINDDNIEKFLSHISNDTDSLALERNSIGDEGAETITKCFPNLKSLNLRANRIRNQGVRAITSNLLNLTSLVLAENQIKDEEVVMISRNLSDLTSLDLGWNHITDEGAMAIGHYLLHLTSLDIRANQIGDKGAQTIGQKLTNLEALDLKMNLIGKAGAEAIAKGLPNLTYLDLGWSNLGDEGTTIIAQNLQQLKILNLRGNQITDAGIEAIIRNLPNLVSLDVRMNNITAKGLEFILENHKKITSLDLGWNLINDKNIKSVVKYFFKKINLDLRGNLINQQTRNRLREELSSYGNVAMSLHL